MRCGGGSGVCQLRPGLERLALLLASTVHVASMLPAGEEPAQLKTRGFTMRAVDDVSGKCLPGPTSCMRPWDLTLREK